MEWFFSLWDQFQASFLWQDVLSKFKWVDWMTMTFIAIGVIYGMQRGLLRVLTEFVETIFVLIATLLLYRQVGVFLGTYFEFIPSKYLEGVGYLLTLIPIWLGVLAIDSWVSRWFHVDLSKVLSVLGGATVGFVFGICLWGIFSHGLILFKARTLNRAYDKSVSVTGFAIKSIIPKIEELLSEKKEDK